MSRRPWERKTRWTPQRCEAFADYLSRLTELDVLGAHCRPCDDPRGRAGLVVEWQIFSRQVEVYFAWSGETTILRREGAPLDTQEIPDRRRLLDPLRTALWWLENRRSPCPPKG